MSQRKDGKDWTDDKYLREWVKSRNPDLIVITRKSSNQKGAMILKSTGEVIHQDESNTSLLENLKDREKAGKTILDSSIRKLGLGLSSLSYQSIRSRILEATKELEYHTSGRSSKFHPPSEIRRKIRDCKIEIQELRGEL